MSKKTSPPEQDRELRQRMLRSATSLFASKGYAATSVREIVKAAGATAPVLYYYFQSKEGIFLEILREAQSHFESTLEECREKQGTPEEKLRFLAKRLHELHCKNIETVTLIHSVYHAPPQGAPEYDFDAFHYRIFETVGSLVEEGISRGEFSAGEPEIKTAALLGAIRFAMDFELCHPESSPGEEGLSKVLDIIFAGMKPGLSDRNS